MNLQIFKNEEFGEVRTITKDDEPMFCLIDICKALEIRNATDVAKRLDEDELTRLNLGSRAGETNFITESGLYAVILRSDKPNARKFLDRIDNEKGYCPENCRWVSRAFNRKHQRKTRYLEIFGVRLNISEWCKEVKMSKSTAYKYLSKSDETFIKEIEKRIRTGKGQVYFVNKFLKGAKNETA